MTASLSEQIIHSHIIFDAWEGYRVVLLVYFPGFYWFCYISSAQSCGQGFSWGCGSVVPRAPAVPKARLSPSALPRASPCTSAPRAWVPDCGILVPYPISRSHRGEAPSQPFSRGCLLRGQLSCVNLETGLSFLL